MFIKLGLARIFTIILKLIRHEQAGGKTSDFRCNRHDSIDPKDRKERGVRLARRPTHGKNQPEPTSTPYGKRLFERGDFRLRARLEPKQLLAYGKGVQHNGIVPTPRLGYSWPDTQRVL